MSDAREIVGVVFTHVPLIIARIGWSSLRLLFGSRIAAGSFKRALRRRGMSRRRAGQLARQYRRQVDVLRFVRRIIRERRLWEKGSGRRNPDGFASKLP